MLLQADSSSWNRKAATHLLNRAAFGGTPTEIDEFQKLGRQKAIDSLFLQPSPVSPPSLGAREKISDLRTSMLGKSEMEMKEVRRQIQRQNYLDMAHVREWWIRQMIRPDSAALEKATLFWHGHFATSINKVKSAEMMWGQNQLLRRFAFGNFCDMVKAISCDPAMVVWLDLRESRKGAPNENFARELMELFTLGIGHYTEDDVKNSARAFTGYRTQRYVGGFDFNQNTHDDGEKLFMGKKGKFGGDDIIDIIFEQPACAEFICEKLWTFYAYEDPEPALVASLADTFRREKYELRPVFAEMFGSAAFYSEKALGTQIKSPAHLIAQTCRTLECEPLPSVLLHSTMRSLGQVLFDPPNVKGWDGNRAWINTATMDARTEFCEVVAGVRRTRRGVSPVALEKLVTDEMLNQPVALVEGFSHRLLAVDLSAENRAELIQEAEKFSKPLSRSSVRQILAKFMQLPEFHLC